MPRHIDFENIEQKLDVALDSPEWRKFVEDINASRTIYVVANGGLWAVGSHAADDGTRLFAKADIEKFFFTLDSQCMMTSLANDFGFNNMFLRWLEVSRLAGQINEDSMIVSLSCSGNSKNVVSCMSWAKKHGIRCAQISGQKSSVMEEGINEVVLDTDYFHTCEVMTLMLFYDMIHELGGACPTIKAEIVRKGSAESLGRSPLGE